jgi:Flp pilus assembly pilin Flp
MYALMARIHARILWQEEDGQATTEYALVLLGAALVALLVVGWATSGSGAGKIGQLFDRVIDSIIHKL